MALKVLPAGVGADAERQERFEREARAAAALNHPNIVTIYSVERVDGVRFLTMELAEGKALAELIPKGGFPLDRFLKIAIPLADAVGAAHQNGITHRDLKPQNVMVGADDRVKVLDFGLAKLKEDAREPTLTTTDATPLTGDGRILGTVAYMSPEQAEGRPLDHRTDIFSLGVMLYEMATGERPFTGETNVSVIAAIVKDTPQSVTELRPQLPRELAKVIRRALAKDPARRYQVAADLRNDLEELVDDLSSGVIAAPAPTPKRRSRRRLWAFAGVGAITLVAALALILRRGNAPAQEAEAQPIDATFTQLTFQAGLELFPSLSPDGKWIVYSSAADGDEDIYLQRVGGRNAINLTPDAAGVDSQPAFSPDGERIAFRSDRGGGGVFVMGRTGDSVRRLTDGGFSPAWSPDGKWSHTVVWLPPVRAVPAD